MNANVLLTPKEMRVALEIGYCSPEQFLHWFRQTSSFDDHAGDWQVAEIFSTNNKDPQAVQASAEAYKEVFERYYEPLLFPSSASELIAKNLFYNRLRQYVSSECQPYDVCRLVAHIEPLFDYIEPLFDYIEPLFDYPSWLGDMYNACDWVEPHSDASECTAIFDEANHLLKALD